MKYYSFIFLALLLPLSGCSAFYEKKAIKKNIEKTESIAAIITQLDKNNRVEICDLGKYFVDFKILFRSEDKNKIDVSIKDNNSTRHVESSFDAIVSTELISFLDPIYKDLKNDSNYASTELGKFKTDTLTIEFKSIEGRLWSKWIQRKGEYILVMIEPQDFLVCLNAASKFL